MKHLIYHMCPLKNEAFEFNLVQLGKYIDLFDGERVINCAQGAGLLNSIEVNKRLKTYGIKAQVILSPNDEGRESMAFRDTLLPALAGLTGYAFFAHTKGVTRKGDNLMLRWAETMYRLNLENVERTEAALKDHTFAGIFKTGQCAPHILHWHYSGTFFWMNLARLFKVKKWKQVGTGRFGVECYPGSLVPETDGACLAYPNLGGGGGTSLYSKDVWEKIDKGEVL